MSTNTATAELERELGKAIVKAVGRKDARRLLAAPNVLQSAVATAAAAWDRRCISEDTSKRKAIGASARPT